jgi:hypothetical protein
MLRGMPAKGGFLPLQAVSLEVLEAGTVAFLGGSVAGARTKHPLLIRFAEYIMICISAIGRRCQQ